jgi:hypothetical protein
MNYTHICQRVRCSACSKTSCQCEWIARKAQDEDSSSTGTSMITNLSSKISYHCPFCGNMMTCMTTTSSSTGDRSYRLNITVNSTNK